jgi:hypothetical protein
MPAKPEEWGTGKFPFLGQHNTHNKVRQRNHKNRKLQVNLFDKKKILKYKSTKLNKKTSGLTLQFLKNVVVINFTEKIVCIVYLRTSMFWIKMLNLRWI